MKPFLSLLFLIITFCPMSFSQTYTLENKWLSGKIKLNKDRTFHLEIRRGVYFRYSSGTYNISENNRFAFLTSNYQINSIKVEQKTSPKDSIVFWLTDLNELPMQGMLVLNDTTKKKFNKGRIALPQQKWECAQIIKFNYLTQKPDTITLNNKGENAIKIKSLNTLTHSNYLFLENESFRLRKGRLISYGLTTVTGKKLKFKLVNSGK